MGVMDLRRNILLNEPHITTANGNLVSFNTDLKAPLKSCRVEFLPVQEGTGDPSPSNVRPITGWDGIIIHNSNNARLLFPNEYPDVTDNQNDNMAMHCIGNGKYVFNNSGEHATNSHTFDFDIQPGIVSNRTTFYLNSEIKHALPSWSVAFSLRDSDSKNILSGEIAYSQSLKDFTSTGVTTSIAGREYSKFRLVVSNDFDGTTVCPIVSSTSASDDTVANVSWASISGTIYGGYVDLISGKVVATHKKVLLNNPDLWAVPALARSYTYDFDFSDRLKGDKTNTFICSYAMTLPSGGTQTPWFGRWYSGSGNGSGYFYLRWNSSSSPAVTIDEVKTAAANNEIELCYELAEPITYQLTPTQLKSMIGENNIWSNANGNVSVQYWTHK